MILRTTVVFVGTVLSYSIQGAPTPYQEQQVKWIKSLPSPPVKPYPTGIPVMVNVTIGFKGMGAITEARSLAEMDVYVVMQWIDPALSWSMSELNSSCIFLNQNQIWIPLLTYIANFVSLTPKLIISPSQVYICSDGSVYLSVENLINVRTEFNTENFPFDNHIITFSLAPIVTGTQEIDIAEIVRVEIPYHKPGAEWSFTDPETPALCKRNVMHIGQYPYNNYPFVNCTIGIKREPLYYMTNFCVPAVLTTFLCYIALFGPTTATGQRANMYGVAMTAMLNMGVLALQLSNQTPKSSNKIPLLVRLLIAFMVVNFLALVSHAFVLFFEGNARKMQASMTGADGKTNPKSQYIALVYLKIADILERVSQFLFPAIIVALIGWFGSYYK